MSDAAKLTPADPSHLADALAFALRFEGRKRVHNADEIMAEIVARRPMGAAHDEPTLRLQLFKASRKCEVRIRHVQERTCDRRPF